MANEPLALISKSYLDRNTVTSSTQLTSVTQTGKYADAKAIIDAIKEGKGVKFVQEGFDDIDGVYDYIRSCKANEYDLYDSTDDSLYAFKCNDGNIYPLISNVADASSLIDPVRIESEAIKRSKNISNVVIKKPIPLDTMCPGTIYAFPHGKPRFKITIKANESRYIVIYNASGADIVHHKYYASGQRFANIQRIEITREVVNDFVKFRLQNLNAFPVTYVFSFTFVPFLEPDHWLSALMIKNRALDAEDNNFIYINEETFIKNPHVPTNTETSSRDIILRNDEVYFNERYKKLAVDRIDVSVLSDYMRNEHADIYFRHRLRTPKQIYGGKICFLFKIFGDFLIITKNQDFGNCEGTITVIANKNAGSRMTQCSATIDLRRFNDNNMVVVEENDEGGTFYGYNVGSASINLTDWPEGGKPICWIGPRKRTIKFKKANKKQKSGILSGMYGINGNDTATIVKLRLKKRGIKSNILHTYYYKP